MFDSFKYAFKGLRDAVKSEANFSIHLLFGLIATIFAYFFKFTNFEFIILVITITSVITLELINTLVEKLVDMHGDSITEEKRIIKDISAAVVLVSSISAVIIGAFLFVPKLLG